MLNSFFLYRIKDDYSVLSDDSFDNFGAVTTKILESSGIQLLVTNRNIMRLKAQTWKLFPGISGKVSPEN